MLLLLSLRRQNSSVSMMTRPQAARPRNFISGKCMKLLFSRIFRQELRLTLSPVQRVVCAVSLGTN
jgi:hypothetical protein